MKNTFWRKSALVIYTTFRTTSSGTDSLAVFIEEITQNGEGKMNSEHFVNRCKERYNQIDLEMLHFAVRWWLRTQNNTGDHEGHEVDGFWKVNLQTWNSKEHANGQTKVVNANKISERGFGEGKVFKRRLDALYCKQSICNQIWDLVVWRMKEWIHDWTRHEYHVPTLSGRCPAPGWSDVDVCRIEGTLWSRVARAAR